MDKVRAQQLTDTVRMMLEASPPERQRTAVIPPG